jgi:hypothetical protein
VNRVFDQDVYKMTNNISGLWWLVMVKRILYLNLKPLALCKARKPIFFFFYKNTTSYIFIPRLSVWSLYRSHLILFFPFNNTISDVNITNKPRSAKHIIMYYTALKTKLKCTFQINLLDTFAA